MSEKNLENPESDLIQNHHRKALALNWKIKTLIMSSASFLILTYFFILALPQGIENNLLASPYNFSNTDYGIFYACLSFPNLISPIFMGVYLDNKGWNIKIIGFLSIFMAIGATFCIFGAYYISFWLLCLGNIFIGIPIENIAFLTKKISLDIYEMKFNVIASGVLLCFARIGQGIGAVLIPFIYSIENELLDVYLFQALFLLGAIFSLLFILFLLPKHDVGREKRLSLYILREIIAAFDKYIYLYWLVSLLILLIFFSFFTNANTFLTISMGISTTEAGMYILILVFCLGLVQVLSSIIMSKVGFLNYWVIGATIVSILCWCLFICFFEGADIYLNLIPLALLGIVHAINTNYYFSGTAIMVPRKHSASALGVLQCIMNLSRMWGPLCFGIVRDLTVDIMNGYLINFFILIGYAIILIIIVVWLSKNENNRFKGMTNSFDT